MKKRYIYLIFGTISLSSLNSCKIDTYPETSLSDKNFWNTTADLRMAANYFYSTLPGLTSSDVSQDVWSGYAFSNSGSDRTISDGSRVAPASSGDYNYYSIFQANNLIEKSADVLLKGGNATEVNWYVGEARFFRAFYYFEMLKKFGGVPIITKTLNINSPELNSPRATREEVLALIFEDLDFAIANLRTPDALNTAKE